jgi:hypothetical protein
MIAAEDIYNALFELPTQALGPVAGGGNGTFKTTTRRLKLVEDVDAGQMPYLGQLQLDILRDIETTQGTLGWEYHAEWYIYVSAPNEDAPSTPLMNPIIDKIRNLFPQEGGSALGFVVDGKVCTILHGAIEFYEGLLGSKSVAKIPVIVKVPN